MRSHAAKDGEEWELEFDDDDDDGELEVDEDDVVEALREIIAEASMPRSQKSHQPQPGTSLAKQARQVWICQSCGCFSYTSTPPTCQCGPASRLIRQPA